MSALDRETEERVLNNIMSSHPDRLIILSTHRPAALRLCNRIYKISGGKISETTIEEALEMQSVLTEPKTTNMQSANYVNLIKPMGPQDDGPSDDNNEDGWWNS
jgi:ABC-type transport system involved in cytochrome bd biosynthesis fused ATPase/permease subunit